MSDGRIYFIENSPCGCEEWKSKNESKLDVARWYNYENIYSDNTEQLQLKGIPKQLTVNVLNNQVKTFEALSVGINFESFNRKIKQKVSA